MKVERRKSRSRFASQRLLGAIQEQRRKGVNRRVHVAEIPFVGGHLAVGVQVGAAQHQLHLILGKVGIHDRERQRVEGQIPCRVPRVSHLSGIEMMSSFSMWNQSRVPGVPVSAMERVGVVLVQPVIAVEEEELLAPQHAGECLTHHVGRVFVDGWRRDGLVELVGFAKPAGEDVVERLSKRSRRLACGLGREPQANDFGLTRADR